LDLVELVLEELLVPTLGFEDFSFLQVELFLLFLDLAQLKVLALAQRLFLPLQHLILLLIFVLLRFRDDDLLVVLVDLSIDVFIVLDEAIEDV